MSGSGKKLQKRANRQRVFHSTFTLWVQKTTKLSKLMSIFPLNKSQHKLTVFHIIAEDVLPK